MSSIPGKTTPANVYILFGVQSGGGKILVFDDITRPLFEYQKELTENWRAKVLPAASAEKITGQKMLKHLEKSLDKVSQPKEQKRIINRISKQIGAVEGTDAQGTQPSIVCENTTSEVLAISLSRNHECLASMSADARDVLDILSGRYRGQGDEGLYLKAFSEDRCEIHRTKRPAIRLYSPNLTCLWMALRDKVNEMFSKKSASESGLLPRFLLAEVGCKAIPIDRNRAPVDDEPLRAWSDLTTTLLEVYHAREDHITIHPADRARGLLDDHYNKLVDRRNSDLQDIESYVARWNEQAWRLALVLHAARWGQKAGSQQLSPETAQNAIELANWFASQPLAKLRSGREAARQYVDQAQCMRLADGRIELDRSKTFGLRICLAGN